MTAPMNELQPEIYKSDPHAENRVAELRRDHKTQANHAETTRRAYDRDWRAFRAWCDRLGFSIPATDAVLATWVGSLDALANSTVRRRLSAVRLAHKRIGHALPAELPDTEAALRGHARGQANRAPRQQQPITAEVLVRLIKAEAGETLHAIRNRAILLVGFDAALGRSEIVAIDHEYLEADSEGYLLTLPCTKGAATGRRVVVALRRQNDTRYCPVTALQRWISVSGRTWGRCSLASERESGRATRCRLIPCGCLIERWRVS